jgi:hypothetical protein
MGRLREDEGDDGLRLRDNALRNGRIKRGARRQF